MPLRLVYTVLVWLAAAAIALGAFAVEAGAQEVKQRKSILELLFGSKKKAKPQETTAPRKRKRPADSAATNPLEPPPVEKAVDARVVLVAGDFMAKALADGLTTAFATSADIRIEPQSNGSSGLVRRDYYDWATELPKLIETARPAAVVIMLGSNDRQQMTIAGSKEKFRTPAWSTEYEARVTALVSIAAQRKIPLIWVGLPPFASPQMSTDAASLNTTYRAATEMVNGQFIDIWDAYADENGKFVVSGSDINGQTVRLRGSDGLSFTKAGKRKLAFYLEKPIRQIIGSPLPAYSMLPETVAKPKDDKVVIEDVSITTVPPISLADPELDGGNQLMGLSDATLKMKPTPRDLLVLKGDPGTAPAGRIDHYVLPEDGATATAQP